MSKEPTLRAGLAIGLALGMPGAHAFEGGISPFPAGSTGEYIAAMPPIPGLFAVEQINYSTSSGLYDNQGRKLPIPFETSAFSATTRLLASYPINVLGANLYSQLVVPAVKLHTDVAGHSERHGGLSNLTISPAILRWGLSPHANMTVGLDIALRSGSYNPARPSVAVGYTSYQPVVAWRYKDQGGLDIGISNRLLLNRTNGDTGYRSGRGYVGDFTMGWNFGQWKVGAVGSYLNQFSDDRLNGVAMDGHRARSFSMGPSIVYDAGAFSIGINYQQGIHAANTARSNALWLNLAFPLWARPPH